MKLLKSLICLCILSLNVNAQSPREILQMADDLVHDGQNATYMMDGRGTIYFKNGTTVEGNLKINFGLKPSGMGQLLLFSETKMQPDVIYPSDVLYVKIGNTMLVPIEAKLEGVTYSIFAVSLNTKLDDKMKMYRYYNLSANSSSSSMGKPYSLNKGFFKKFPDDRVATEMGGFSFTPFAKGMSKEVSDCEALSKKIKDKEDGYKYNLIDLKNTNPEVFLRIMTEYNECK
jgi:hypothetical protein